VNNETVFQINLNFEKKKLITIQLYFYFLDIKIFVKQSERSEVSSVEMSQDIKITELSSSKCNNLLTGLATFFGILGGVYLLTTRTKTVFE